MFLRKCVFWNILFIFFGRRVVFVEFGNINYVDLFFKKERKVLIKCFLRNSLIEIWYFAYFFKFEIF